MTGLDLVIRGAQVVLETGPVAADLGIADGRVASLMEPGRPVAAAEEIDARGLTILPGAIDPHLHLGHGKDIARPREPSDAAMETAAAAVGGVTCFVPYLMGTGPYSDIFDEVVSVTEAGARIDFGYHLIISTEEQLAEVAGFIRERGVPTFKIFMNNRGREGARLHMPDLDDGFLFRLCEVAAENGGVVCPHPENIEIAWVLRDRAKASDPDGKGGLATWNATRPPFVEAEAVQRAGYLGRVTGSPVYIVHTSSAEALEAGLRARQAGAAITIETCPHYLTHDIGWPGGEIGKINPPLREASDREALWRGVADGSVDTIGTDHVHRDLSAKQGGIWGASPGCPGLETMLPVMLSEGHAKRGIPLARIAAVTSANAARALGLGRRKGRIALGYDADLAIVDLGARWTVERGSVVSGAGYSIYEGVELQGRIVHTIVRGRPVLRDGILVDQAVGTGLFMSRALKDRDLSILGRM